MINRGRRRYIQIVEFVSTGDELLKSGDVFKYDAGLVFQTQKEKLKQ
jgi:hypothetical protein